MKILKEELEEISGYLTLALDIGMVSLVMPAERELWHKPDFEPCVDEREALALALEKGAEFQVTGLLEMENRLRLISQRRDLGEVVDVPEMQGRMDRELRDFFELLKENGLYEPALEDKVREFREYRQYEELKVVREARGGKMELVVHADLERGYAKFLSLGARRSEAEGEFRLLVEVPLVMDIGVVDRMLSLRDLGLSAKQGSAVAHLGEFEKMDLPSKVRLVEDQLKEVGLYEKAIGGRVAGYFFGDGPVVLQRELAGEKFRLMLNLRFGDVGKMELLGYTVMTPAKADYVDFVHKGIDTRELEDRFARLDHSFVDSPDGLGKLSSVELRERLEVFELINTLRDGQQRQSNEMNNKIDDFIEGMYVKYGGGKGLEDELVAQDAGWLRVFYDCTRFEPVHINLLTGLINDKTKLGELADSALWPGEERRKIMNASNLEALKGEMAKLGFGENLIGQMEAKMASNEPRFILYDEQQHEKGRLELGLHFNQSKSSEFYYLNKFDAVLEKQPPLAPGEQYFVSSQRQGEEAQVREYQMPSLAVKDFNAKLEGSKEIRGTAEISVGADPASAKQIASMADGKLLEFEKDFYRTLKNPAPAQTFYLEKGNGFTLPQAMNLLAGRSVFREDMLNISKNEYTAWTKLDFDAPRDRGGNFHMKTFSEGYKFDLGAVLDRFDFKELATLDKRADLEAALKNGDRAVVTVDMGGKKEAILVEAVPEFKQVNLYSLEGKSIKREDHQKQEQLAEVGVGRDKGVKKGRDQEQGMGV